MGWTFTLGLPLALILFFVVLTVILRITGGYAPGWHIRCATCNAVRDAASAGILRLRAVGRPRTVGWCSHCRALRLLVIERNGEC